MSESLARRVGRLVAGSFNAAVDAVENAAPETVMEQALRELDSAIAEVRRDLGAIEAQRHLTARRLVDERARYEELGSQAQLALREEREDLATVAVERQIDIEAQLPVLESRLNELGEEKKQLEGYIGALQAKKREMQDALQAFRSSRQTAAASATGTAGTTANSGLERAERASTAFDRVFTRQTGIAGTSTTAVQEAAQLAELEALSHRHRVQERLARLKMEKSS